MCADDVMSICQWAVPEASAQRQEELRFQPEYGGGEFEGFMPDDCVSMCLSEASVCCLTTLEPCFVQARVRGGFPVHAHVKAASVPVSTVIGLGSDSSLGPTRVKRHDQYERLL